MALVLTIDGTDRTALLGEKSLSITRIHDVFTGRCDFVLHNLIPATTDTVTVTDGATTYFDGVVTALALSELKSGAYSCRVSVLDAVTPPAETLAPFSLSDQSDEATYLDYMTGANTSSAGWINTGIYVPYAWWRLGESAGTDAVDEMAFRTGKYMNTPTLGAAGAMTTADTAVTFNGTDEYVDCGVAMLAGQTDFSIAAWFKTSSADAIQTIYCERNATTGNALIRLYIDANGRPTFQYRDNAGTLNTNVPASGDWSDGAWHHVAVTKAGTALVIYVDGVSKKTATLTANNTLSGTIVAAIGCDPRDGQFFPGDLDEVMIWRNAIHASMARQIYAMRDIRRYASLTIDYTASGLVETSTGTVSTYDAGLDTGQTLSLTSANFGLHGMSVLVQELRVTWQNATTPLYTATIGDAPIKLAAAFP